MTKLGRVVCALTLSLALLALILVLMPFAGQRAVRGDESALMSSATSSDQQINILVDDFAQQFNQGHPCEFHNRLGGERWPIGRSEDVHWGRGVVTAVITTGEHTAGVWTSLNHHVYECTPVNFSAVFPSQIITQYQGYITGIQIHILDGRGTFQVQLQIGEPNHCPPQTAVYTMTEALTGGEQYISSSLSPDLGEVQNLNWQVIGEAGDFVVVNRVELTATVPQLDTPRQGFLWSYAMLLSNWDPESGLTRDHACYEANEFDNISASGFQAAAAVMASELGFISKASATEIVSKTTQGLLGLSRDNECGSGLGYLPKKLDSVVL